MSYTVIVAPAARNDLLDLDAWIAAEANEEIAGRYVDRIEQRISRLSVFPNRGSKRDDLGPQVRALSFERRILILYIVSNDIVDVLRVVSVSRLPVDLGAG